MSIRPLVGAIALLIAATIAWPAAGVARSVSKATRHLSFTATANADSVTPGTRFSLAFDIRPKRGMHVYAPGTKYRPVAIAIDADPALTMHNVVYPPPVTYVFRPLNEEVFVYQAPFRLTLDLTAGATPALQALLAARSQIAIKGQLTYQACDDKVCYLPAAVPFTWTIPIKK